MARDRDLYRRLGLKRDASPQDVHRAYRRAARDCHPDVVGGSAESWGALVEAYDVLRDPGRRQRYDETGEVGAAAADNHQAAVLIRIAAALSNIAEAARQQRRKLSQIDWPNSLRTSLAAEIQQERDGLVLLRQMAEEWERVAARATVPAGEANVLRALASGKVAECQHRIAQVEREIGEREEAIELLKNQGFTIEDFVPQPYPQFGQFGLFGRTRAGEVKTGEKMW